MSTAPPYVSQWGDLDCNHAVIERGEDPAALHDWRRDGYASAEDYRLWSRNTCGLACLASVLGALGQDVPRVSELVAGAVASGALVPQADGRVDGLYYHPFVRWVREAFPVEAEVRPELAVDEVVDLVRDQGRYVMASVSTELRWPERPPTRRGGHLVLVYDAEGDDLVFHNPSGLGPTAAGARCSSRTFSRSFAGRGIVMGGRR